MKSIKRPPFSKIISLLAVGDHTVEVNTRVWSGLLLHSTFSHPITSAQSSGYLISRTRLLTHQYKTNEDKCLEILMWGYPKGGRGNNIKNALANLTAVVAAASTSHCCWHKYKSGFRRHWGVGTSTATKFAYFFNQNFSGHRALILDGQIATALNSPPFAGIPNPVEKHQYQWDKNYPAYLEEMSTLASALKVKPDQVELFLFLLAKHFR